MYFSVVISLVLFLITPVYYTEKELKSIQDEYMSIVNLYCNKNQYFHSNKIILKFSNLQEEHVGLCTTFISGYKIEIDKQFWEKSNKDTQFQLLVHEMRHCMFKADHSENENNYMYKTLNDLTKREVINQAIIDLRVSCGKN